VASLTFDPRGENASNQPLEVFAVPDGSAAVSAMSFPTPSLETATVGSIDTEGDGIAARRHQNRSLSLTVEILEPSGLAAATNVVTNPSPDLDTAGWTTAAGIVNAGATVSRIAHAGSAPPDYAFQVTGNGASTLEGCYTLLNLTSGQPYTAIVRAAVLSGSSINIAVVRNSSPFTRYTLASAVSASAETDYSLTFTPAFTGQYALLIEIISATATTVQFTNAFVAESGPYFDGDTPGCAWTGTPHASTSTRPASNGTRFRAAVADLEAKVAKLALTGGTLRWVNDGGESFTFDVLATDQYDKTLDVAYFSGPVAIATIQLTARPYARQPEVTLSSHSSGFFSETITGDVPALARLVITDTATQNYAFLVWGVDPFNSGASYALQAEAGTLGAGTLAATAGASGSGNNSVAQDLSPASTWLGGLTITADRIGTFRVFARVRLPATNAGTVSTRLVWSSEGATENTAVTIDPSLEGSWVFVDLGLASARANRHGQATLSLLLQAFATTIHDDIVWDYVLLVPCDRTGQLVDQTGANALVQGKSTEIADDGVLINDFGGVWRSPGWQGCVYEGDYLTLEAGTSNFVVQALTGLGGLGSVHIDSPLGAISTQVFYKPRWLNVR
jgi:hypothetical protein